MSSNNRKVIFVISPFTPRGFEPGKGGGGMSYNTANTVEGFNEVEPDVSVIILAEADSRFKPVETYANYTVIRCWERNSLKTWINIYKEIRKRQKDYDECSVLIQFEFAAYGSMLSTLLIQPFFIALRVRGIRVVTVIHQVLLDLNSISKHVGIENKLLILFFSFGLKAFYILTVLLSKQIIVFEQILKIRLLKLHLQSRKIKTIPHGIIKFQSKIDLNKYELKAKYGYHRNDFIIVLFGYMAWYKGTDWLVNAVDRFTKSKHSSTKLIIAGGPSATQSEKQHYNDYYVSIFDKASRNPNIRITGFVPDEEVEAYLKLADLLVFPYRVLMSSSGPLSWALVYERPFLMSSKMKGYLKTNDAKKLVGKTLTTPDQILFDLNHIDFYQKIELYKHDHAFVEELKNYSTQLGNERVWSKLAPKYLSLLFPENKIS